MNILQLLKLKESRSALLVFISYGIMFSSWFIYIPFTKQLLMLSDIKLAASLLFISLGGLIVLPFTHRLVNYLGANRSTLYFIILFVIAIILPPFANSFYILCLLLFIVGLTSSLLNVSMNTLALNIEKNNCIKLMSTCHAFFSLGTFIGSGIGTFFLFLKVSKLFYLIIVAVILIYINVANYNRCLNTEIITINKTKFNFEINLQMFPAMLIVFFIMLGEGAIADWSAIFLRNNLFSTQSLAGLGYTFFSIGMCLGRFSGDSISKYLAEEKILFNGLLISISGLLLLQISIFISSLIGFFLIGLGCSTLVPLIFRRSTFRIPNPSKGIAMLSGAGSIGFIFGPIIFGTIAQFSNLRYSFFFLTACFFICVYTSKSIFKNT